MALSPRLDELIPEWLSTDVEPTPAGCLAWLRHRGAWPADSPTGDAAREVIALLALVPKPPLLSVGPEPAARLALDLLFRQEAALLGVSVVATVALLAGLPLQLDSWATFALSLLSLASVAAALASFMRFRLPEPPPVAQAADRLPVLLLCWGHPHRTSAAAAAATIRPPEDGLPGPVADTLADLRLLADDAPPEDVNAMQRILFQRLEEAGYRWEGPSAPTYSEDLRRSFEILGLPQPGDPVRVRRPALLRHGRLVRKGELRKG